MHNNLKHVIQPLLKGFPARKALKRLRTNELWNQCHRISYTAKGTICHNWEEYIKPAENEKVGGQEVQNGKKGLSSALPNFP